MGVSAAHAGRGQALVGGTPVMTPFIRDSPPAQHRTGLGPERLPGMLLRAEPLSAALCALPTSRWPPHPRKERGPRIGL